MKRPVALIVSCVLAVGLTAGSAVSAEAAKAPRDRTPGCVTKWEYDHVRVGMAPDRLAAHLGTWGSLLRRVDDGFWESSWVDEGYWESDGYWEDASTWVDLSYWVDDSYYDAYHRWTTLIDTVRSYRKCPGFDGGRGRVGINLDNYTSEAKGMHVSSTVRFQPQTYLAPAGGRLARKAKPSSGAFDDATVPASRPRPSRPAPPARP